MIERQKLQTKSKFIIVIAVGVLIASLAFAAVRLLQVEHNLRKGEAFTQLWRTSQTQYEMALLADSLARHAVSGSIELQGPSPLLRYRKIMDLIATARTEDTTRGMAALPEFSDLKRAYLYFTMMGPVLEGDLTREQALSLEATTRDFASLLQTISAKVMVIASDREAAERSSYLRLVFDILASMIGVFVSAAVLFFGVFRGMRETTRTKRLLQQEQELSDLVINNISNQGIVIFDEWLNCLLWNPGMETMLGVRSSEVVGQGLREAVPFFHKPDVFNSLMQAVAGTSSVFEDAGLSQDARDRCLEINCFPLNIAERKLGIAFMRDVTESWLARRQAEQANFNLEIQVQQRTAALRQAERRLIAAIETAPEGFAAFDATGRLLFANERIRSSEPVSIWCGTEMTLPVFLQCFALCEGADDRLLRVGPVFEEISLDLMISKDNWAHLSVTKADAGTVFVRLTDISGYKQAAKALQSALERERETTSAYRSFVSMVSHQFRTPLAILDSGAQRLLRRGPNVTHDELVIRVQRMRSATNRLTRLVESVLNAAKIDAGRMEFNPTECRLGDIIWDICERQKELSSHADIRFEAPAQPVTAYCDSILIEQVIINLLSNAVKYSGDNPVVEVKIWTDSKRAYCSVRDSGIGIPPDELSKIFDRFYRARTATGIAGTGIGLNFAQKIMHLHGGALHVQSREALGSIFTFDLPLKSAEEEPKAA